MIAEPYICIKGFKNGYDKFEAGEIHSFTEDVTQSDPNPEYWMPYAEFERRKLKQLGITYHKFYLSLYWSKSPEFDSESDRIIKRAEHLKEFCMYQKVEWLPTLAPEPSAENCPSGRVQATRPIPDGSGKFPNTGLPLGTYLCTDGSVYRIIKCDKPYQCNAGDLIPALHVCVCVGTATCNVCRQDKCDHAWLTGNMFRWCEKCLLRDREYERKHLSKDRDIASSEFGIKAK